MSDDQRSRGGDIAIARYVPPVSVPDMERMANAIVASGLFGVRTVPQALTLMWLAQAEGRHPVLAARDYHIIEGKPSKTAEAMMRDFLAARGTVEWHQLDDTAAEATFSHPLGGEVRIKWDMERAGQAGLLGRRGDMWKRYPRQMLRSRCVSEGIRTVGPMATSGLYVPEEVGDYESRQRRGMKDVTPPPAPAPYDPETGEIFTPDPLPDRARRMAEKGTDMLRNWLQDLSRDDRASLRDLIGTREAPGELLQLAQQADAEALRERLQTPEPPAAPVGTPEAPAGVPPAEAVPAGEQSSPHPASGGVRLPMGAGDEIPADGMSQPRHRERPVAKDDPPSAGDELIPQTHRWSIPKRPVARDWELFDDWLVGKMADGVSGRALRVDNEHALRLMRDADPARYDAIQERLAR